MTGLINDLAVLCPTTTRIAGVNFTSGQITVLIAVIVICVAAIVIVETLYYTPEEEE